jgi:hypothetical protein
MPPLIAVALVFGLGYYALKAFKKAKAHVREDLEKVRHPALEPSLKTLKKDPKTGEYTIDG